MTKISAIQVVRGPKRPQDTVLRLKLSDYQNTKFLVIFTLIPCLLEYNITFIPQTSNIILKATTASFDGNLLCLPYLARRVYVV